MRGNTCVDHRNGDAFTAGEVPRRFGLDAIESPKFTSSRIIKRIRLEPRVFEQADRLIDLDAQQIGIHLSTFDFPRCIRSA